MHQRKNEGCHRHSSGRCSLRSPLLFQQHFLIDQPAPVALLAFWQDQFPRATSPTSAEMFYPSRDTSHFNSQDYPDTMEGLSPPVPMQSLHKIFPWIKPCVSHPAIYQGIAMGCSLMNFSLDPKLSKHFPSTGRDRGKAPITSTIIDYKSIPSSAWILPRMVVFSSGLHSPSPT